MGFIQRHRLYFGPCLPLLMMLLLFNVDSREGETKRLKGRIVHEPVVLHLAEFLPYADGDEFRSESGRIILPAGAGITWYFALPEDGVLEGEGRIRRGRAGSSDTEPGISGRGSLSPESATALSGGLITLSVRDEDGSEHVLLQRAIEAGGTSQNIVIKERLESFSGKMAAVTLGFMSGGSGLQESAAAPSAEVELVWKDLRIEGRRAAPSTEGVSALRGRYNVIIFLFDALRADFIEPYGGSGVQTPCLTQLAGRGTVFHNAFANASRTHPSVPSLLTGLHPSAHMTGFGKNRRLADDLPTLPELLQPMGYRTLGIFNSGRFDPAFGFNRGYETVHLMYKDDLIIRRQHATPEARARHVWESYLDPFIGLDDKAPFFCYLHEIDPHSPYEPPAPYDRLYLSDDDGASSIDPRALKRMMRKGVGNATEAELEYLRSQYKGEVSFVDEYLRHLISLMAERGLAENTLVVFTTDHGEAFMEHGQIGHGGTLYDELVRAPIIFSLPGVIPEGRRPRAVVQLTDLAPTILDLVGASPPETMQGESLLPLLLVPDEKTFDRPAVFMAEPHMHGIGFRGWKLHRRTAGEDRHEYQLYNTVTDPGETEDLWDRETVVGGTLRQMLARQLDLDSRRRSGTAVTVDDNRLDPATLRNLRALGYVE